jgi:hypothetical protein
MHPQSFSPMGQSSTAFTRRSNPMKPTYADILLLSAAYERTDRPACMPLLGFVSGLGLAVVLWSAIGSLAWALLN